MNVINAFIKRRPVLSCYVLTFAVIVGGPGFFAGICWQTDPRFVPAVLAMLTGPAIAGLLLTGPLSGRPAFVSLDRGWSSGA